MRVGRSQAALEPSHLALAGSFTRVVWAQKGDTLHADFAPLGGIALQFVQVPLSPLAGKGIIALWKHIGPAQ